MLMANHVRGTRGFALPTILLASTLMMIVLVVAVSALASISVSMQSQYMDQLAREAAESGLTRGADCIHQNSGVAQWGGPSTPNLYPTSGCGGASATPGVSCDPLTTPSLYSLNNSLYTGPCNLIGSGSTTGRVYSTFTVKPPSTSGTVTILTATGTSGQLRANGSPIAGATHTVTLSLQLGLNLNGIASGNDTTCSIQNGQLYCWGNNDHGQVGNGTTNNTVTVPYHVQNFPPVTVGGVTYNYNYVQYVATGIWHTCAVVGTSPQPSDGNQVYCWGDNSMGQFGIGSPSSGSPTPVPGGSGMSSNRYIGCTTVTTDCTAISARDHTCVITEYSPTPGSTANVGEYCWGRNNWGQAGLNSDLTVTDPKTSAGKFFQLTDNSYLRPTNIANVSGDGGCAVMTGAVYCWGANVHGELGNGTHGGGTNPKAVAALVVTSGVTKVTTNNARACAIKSGALYCWGANGPANGLPDYRLDSGSAVNSKWDVDTPVSLVSSSIYGGAVTDFAITDWNTCVVVTGKVWCSGYNDLGQLGQGTTGSYNSSTNTDNGPLIAHGAATSPSQVRAANVMVQVKGALSGQTVVDITSGNNHFCAITTGHEAYCWGDNSLGQLGNGSTSNASQPTKTHIPTTIIF